MSATSPLISRRALLLATTSLSLCTLFPFRSADALTLSETGFNGGRTQVNLTSVGNGGDFTFINLMKMSQGWSYNHPPSDPEAPPSPIVELDENGYVTRIFPGTNGVYTVFQMPTKTQYSGEWLLRWDGNGTLEMGAFSTSRTGGSLISLHGSGSYKFRRADDSGSPGLRVVYTASYPNHVRNIRLCKLKNQALLDAGEQFDPDSLALMRLAKPGVIRSLGWGGLFNGTNDSQATIWARRMPRTNVSYGSPYANPAFYGGRTTNRGSDYILNFTGFTLTDKAMATLVFNANSPQTGSTTINYSVRSGQPIIIPWPSHGLAVGNAVAFGNNGAQPPGIVEAKTYYIISSGFSDNSFQVSASPGRSAVLATSTHRASCVAISIPRININNTGFVPITSYETPIPGNVFIGFNLTQYPSANFPSPHLSHLVYDAAVGYFYMNQGGYTAGVPPEVFIDYCAAVGAHPHLVTPYLSVEPVSDFMTSWAFYATSTYPWMKPRIEPPNECWNGVTAFRGTFYANSLAYVLWRQANGLNETYGKWCSTLGQAMSALYGNDRSKYSMICSIQTVGGYNGGIPDARLKSTQYVDKSGGSPAYLWVDRICAANYFSPSERYTCQELMDAFNYSVTHAGNPKQQSALADGYVDTCSGSNTPFTIEYVTRCFAGLKAWAQRMPSGSTVRGMTCYEGGYSSDYLGGDWSTNIIGAARADRCVLTLAPTSQNSEQSGMIGNPAVAGLMLHVTGVSGMTQLNCSSGLFAEAVMFMKGSAAIRWASSTPLIVGQMVSFNSNVIFQNGVSPLPQLNPVVAPLESGRPYYVVAVGAGTFEVSPTKSGSPVIITGTPSPYVNTSIQSGWLIVEVKASSVTIDVDSTTFGTHGSGGLATYDNSHFYSNVLRQAGGGSSSLGTQNTLMYRNLAALAGPDFVFEYPSNFIYTGTGNIWPVLNPSVYATPTPQWKSIVAWNTH